MRRMIKYVGPDGEKHIAIQNVEASRPRANQLLAMTAKHSGWTEVEAFHPEMKDHEIRGHINALSVEKGIDPPYSEEDTQPPVEDPTAAEVTITDHAEKPGVPAPMHPPAAPRTVPGPHTFPPVPRAAAAPSLAHPETPAQPAPPAPPQVTPNA